MKYLSAPTLDLRPLVMTGILHSKHRRPLLVPSSLLYGLRLIGVPQVSTRVSPVGHNSHFNFQVHWFKPASNQQFMDCYQHFAGEAPVLSIFLQHSGPLLRLAGTHT
ncbi:hypothetical protein HAX54_003370 [Datura stramonium]|uniref:Uncharacterized protein n=1 Tax=Datura stramonium TaxID=4076 RepID=A0ABS8T588_DATST|nr:hypothetical protein [Datura stramonium]